MTSASDRPNLTFDFGGQVVIVTGAARGIGLEIGRFFAQAGADVCLVDRDADVLESAAGEIGARWQAADVADSAAVDAVDNRVVAESGVVDVLVNNAGILCDGVWKLTDDWDARWRCTPALRSVSRVPVCRCSAHAAAVGPST